MLFIAFTISLWHLNMFTNIVYRSTDYCFPFIFSTGTLDLFCIDSKCVINIFNITKYIKLLKSVALYLNEWNVVKKGILKMKWGNALRNWEIVLINDSLFLLVSPPITWAPTWVWKEIIYTKLRTDNQLLIRIHTMFTCIKKLIYIYKFVTIGYFIAIIHCGLMTNLFMMSNFFAEHGQPDQITKSLVPQRNSLVFFEVTPVSFHQVCVSSKQSPTTSCDNDKTLYNLIL